MTAIVEHPADLGRRHCVIVFVKAPLPGKVKTRLARHMDALPAARLYQCFVEDILAMLAGCGTTVRIFFHPREARYLISTWLGPQQHYQAQSGDCLGMKMARAFAKTFSQGFNRVLLIGTDFPDLPAEVIQEGLAQLDRHDAVIGPTFDGGYYLMGLKPETHADQWFERIAWSTPTVLTETMARFRAHGLRVHRLTQWRDIDTWDDLQLFIDRALSKGPGSAVKTRQYLQEIGII